VVSGTLERQREPPGPVVRSRSRRVAAGAWDAARSGGSVAGSGDRLLPCVLRPGEWRNWQTRTVQVRVSLWTWGFKSPLAHTHRRSRASSPRTADSPERPRHPRGRFGDAVPPLRGCSRPDPVGVRRPQRCQRLRTSVLHPAHLRAGPGQDANEARAVPGQLRTTRVLPWRHIRHTDDLEMVRDFCPHRRVKEAPGLASSSRLTSGDGSRHPLTRLRTSRPRSAVGSCQPGGGVPAVWRTCGTTTAVGEAVMTPRR
jgi:hypothetical protein